MSMDAIWMGLGAAIGALSAAAIAVINAWHKNRQEVKDSALGARDRHIDRLEKRISLLEQHIDQQQALIQELYNEHSECQVEISDLWGVASRLHDLARKSHTDVPDLPPRKPRSPRTAQTEYALRTSAHNTGLIKETSSRSGVHSPPAPATPPQPPGPTHPRL